MHEPAEIVQEPPDELLQEVVARMQQPPEAVDLASQGRGQWPELQPVPASGESTAMMCGVSGCCVHLSCLQHASAQVSPGPGCLIKFS